MKIKFMFLAGAMALSLSSCLKDDVEELQDRLGELESELGKDSPIVAEFSTKTTEGEVIALNKSFIFKSADGESQSFEDYGNDEYGIYVERFSDVEWSSGAWVYFEWDNAAKAVTFERGGIYFYDKYWNWINPYFDENNYPGNTVTVTVNSIDPATGMVDFTFVASSSTDSGNNEYAGQVMNLKMDFRGKLPVFISQ